ncbi:hydrogenase maturation nickel metallochaperone HypA [Mariprofundus erugo]|uniref:Hydrogenase maturation factor HypA n=1 Tax=Mariprofundus erugo TaxID=2528639 RepID=A0A5R9GRV1_9PROT|nr:hydrogenase maturation nickel metallochaperone HypA [Mariprofundus erugo]TLS68278.1 hydrogenase maturation nickel metallochaperone HypA [Mariprofundus erugo]TLS77134.1 hydrogenase maturation nickel metallochaperone HypA [Mariprofundus erugo]
MHELSLCEGIVELLQERAAIDHFSQVKTVQLQIGQLSCVEPEAMRFAFGAVSKNSVAAGATLNIEPLPGIGWCHRCAAEVAIGQRYDPCPLCGTAPIEIRQGDEMRIKHVEVV